MLALGLMSGTSCDGVDASIIETDGQKITKYIADHFLPYDNDCQHRILALMHDFTNWPRLDKELTDYHIKAIHEVCKIAGLKRVDVIGCHGQTISHQPQYGTSWQIVNPQIIASTLQTDVIGNFRQRDLSYGGMGAPLVPIFHQAITLNIDKPIAVINIGGISNITFINDDELVGYDIGPGNALINDAMIKYFNKPYDQDGRIAKSGKANRDIIEQILQDEYFRKPSPKTLDRNHFVWIQNLFHTHQKEDIVATLTDLTAEAICLNINDQLKHIYLCGGGTKNSYMVDLIKSRYPNIRIDNISSIGLNADFIESQAFAFLAARCKLNLPSTFPTTTGVNQAATSGVCFAP